MEFNMKFETTTHCDNVVEKFGNRSLSWNGALILYYVQLYVDPDV